MKKVLSVLMAGAMVAGMSMSAFAANPADKSIVYDDDGEKNGDVYAKSTTRTSYRSDINIDGVVPNAELYIPIGPSMSDITTYSDSTSTAPSNAEVLAQLLNDGAVELKDDLEKDQYYMKDNLTDVQAKEGPADKILASKVTGLTPVAVSNEEPKTPEAGKFVLTMDTDKNAAGAEEVKTAGNIDGLNAYIDSDDMVLCADTAKEITDAIQAAKEDNPVVTVTGAVTKGKQYYKVKNHTNLATDVSKAKEAATTVNTGKYTISLNSLTDKDLFKFKVDKDDGSKYVNKIEVIEDKKLGSLDRTAYLKIKLNDSQTTSDLKSTGTVSFKAKKSSTDAKNKLIDGESWESGQEIKINYTLWINNEKIKGSDGEADTGDRVFFDPENNEKNTLIWGDDRAALYFEGNDDASKFYARLQTKADSEIYSVYGDPLNAELWFYDFVGNPTVPSTSRATLTLGIPWDDDDDYTPNPHDCYIYEKDADGNLIDVTSKFTYDEDNDGTTDIEGWTIKTRTLGTYIVSDTELDTTIADDDVTIETPDDNDDASTTDGGKEIPNTGSSDMVGAAVVAAVVSLAAAGAVAFKKASK